MQESYIFLVPGGFTGDTVLNMRRGIRDAKDKNTESTDNNGVTRALKKAADISKQMTLGKGTVDKLEAIKGNNKTLEDVGKLNKPRMEEILVVYGKTVRVHTAKDTLRLDCIVALNASGVIMNGAVV